MNPLIAHLLFLLAVWFLANLWVNYRIKKLEAKLKARYPWMFVRKP